jgi:hypothetical protein
MSPKLINEKRLAKVQRMREIIHELMDCETEADVNAVVELYKKDILKLKLDKFLASTIKRIETVHQ